HTHEEGSFSAWAAEWEVSIPLPMLASGSTRSVVAIRCGAAIVALFIVSTLIWSKLGEVELSDSESIETTEPRRRVDRGCDMAKVSDEGCRLIRNYEGLRLQAYKDPVGIWTIGYGSTIGVKEGMIITAAEAEGLLKQDLEHFERGVENSLRRPANQHQFDSLVSLAYNIGLTAFRQSTLLRKFNQGDTDGAAKEFLRWIRAGSRVLPGLVKRRAAEKAIFETRTTLASH
ncbi:MAG: lysozyme, partial [Nitrososphaera sp.]